MLTRDLVGSLGCAVLMRGSVGGLWVACHVVELVC